SVLTFANGVKAQTYYVEVVGAEGDADADYSLEVVTIADDYGSTSKTEGVLSQGDAIPVSVQWEGDVDWLELEAEGDTAYTIYLSSDSATSGALRLVDKKGEEIATETASVSGTQLVGLTFRTDAKGGTYYVEVAGDATTTTGDYSLSLVTDADDYGETAKTAGELTAPTADTPTTKSGEVQWQGDLDWLELEAAADTRYTIRLAGDGSADALAAGSLSLLDKKGEDQGDLYEHSVASGDLDGLIFTNGAKAGTYYIQVAGADTSDLGGYGLDISIVEDQEGDTAKTAATVGSADQAGHIDWAGDVDWFALDVETDTHYTITLNST
ncbi:hypothetical protein, partial [Imhoffiella purpurea]|uniref:hypothetical protein n=1 Tax=Imhoffiella purpurea TaxID=1249627 RepID=UPI0005C168C3